MPAPGKKKGTHTPGAEESAQQAWCDEKSQHVIGHLDAFLAHPVSERNRDDVLRQIQNWIVKERRKIANSMAEKQN
jgi:hypothetical protein